MTEHLLPPRSPIRRPAPALLAATLLAALAIAGASFPVRAQQPASAAPVASAPVKAVAASGLVATDHDGPRWTELSAAQRKVLAPLAADWNDGIDSRGKERWLDVAARFHKMPAEEQQRANQRMVEWAHMTIAQRTRARENFQESRAVSKEEREARWKAYQALPEEKKRELAKRAAAATAPASAASTGVAVAHRHQPPPLTAIQPKKANAVAQAASGHAPAGSAPLVAQQRPGATTAQINKHAGSSAHLHDGQPKVAAAATSVDCATLLPKRASQPGASPAACSTAPAHP